MNFFAQTAFLRPFTVGRSIPFALAVLGLTVLRCPAAPIATEYDFAAMHRPAPSTASFSDPEYNIWCGSAVKDHDGHFTKRGYSLALWESADGFDWELARHPFVANP